jgi:pyruvate dehydrogenase E1 component
VLGTDGFGRSDYAQQAARVFRGGSPLRGGGSAQALADEGRVKPAKVAEAIAKYGIDPAKPNPANA